MAETPPSGQSATTSARCSYHPKREAMPDSDSEDGYAHDELGEYRMPWVGPLLLCSDCVQHFQDEPFDYEEWK